MKAHSTVELACVAWVGLGAGLGFVVSCQSTPPASQDFLAEPDVSSDEWNGQGDDIGQGADAKDSVDCQADLDACVTACSGALCSSSGVGGGDAFETCVQGCYQQFRSCCGGWQPTSCDQAIEGCLKECAPYYPADPTFPWPDECVNACYALQEECGGQKPSACYSDEDCGVAAVCAWSVESCPNLDGCDGVAGVCVPANNSDTCEDALSACLAECEKNASCDATEFADPAESGNCVAICYDKFDSCSGMSESSDGGCESDADCPSGAMCYFEPADCDPQTGECTTTMGICVPMAAGYDCDSSLVSCLDSCAALFDCSDGSTDCVPSTPDNNQSGCETGCWAAYEDCLYPTSDCDTALVDCLGACPVVCDMNGCSPDPQCASACDVEYSECLGAE